RSVMAPTGMRPSAPTITGTATTRACWKLVSPSDCLKCAPRGDSRAHAQNVTAKPTVAVPSMMYAPPAEGVPVSWRRLVFVAMIISGYGSLMADVWHYYRVSPLRHAVARD